VPRIFVSYRRSDSQGWAGRLGERFARAFGDVALFFDIESIAPGDDFVEAIDRSLAESEVALVLIGPGWLTASLPDGRRRLDDPGDFVRLEIETALARKVRVIPVLLGGTAMPAQEKLPASLAPFARRNAFELSDLRWDYDCERLLDAIEKTTSLRRLESEAGGDTGSIKVAEGLGLAGVRAGDIAGIKGEGAVAGTARIEVAKGAKVTDSTLGDIVGVKSTGPAKDRK
jgi:TIR domain-containing protein